MQPVHISVRKGVPVGGLLSSCDGNGSLMGTVSRTIATWNFRHLLEDALAAQKSQWEMDSMI